MQQNLKVLVFTSLQHWLLVRESQMHWDFLCCITNINNKEFVYTPSSKCINANIQRVRNLLSDIERTPIFLTQENKKLNPTYWLFINE